ncbi:MAG TPA: hypothetical protein VL593_00630 [Ramlibacter sp.]|jgi:hypothetical protein|nr:hypothetical protein [Ramlibacter sp.]
MKQSSYRTLVKNIVVAITLGVAAVATLAVTQTNAPQIEVASAQTIHG